MSVSPISINSKPDTGIKILDETLPSNCSFQPVNPLEANCGNSSDATQIILPTGLLPLQCNFNSLNSNTEYKKPQVFGKENCSKSEYSGKSITGPHEISLEPRASRALRSLQPKVSPRTPCASKSRPSKKVRKLMFAPSNQIFPVEEVNESEQSSWLNIGQHFFQEECALHSAPNDDDDEDSLNRDTLETKSDPYYDGYASDSYGSDDHAKTWERQTEELVKRFPNVDPSYIKSECWRMKTTLDVVTQSILTKLEKNKDLATVDDTGCRYDIERVKRNKGNIFSFERILKLLPDPWAYFTNMTRSCRSFSDHSLHYLKTSFRKHYAVTIRDALIFHNYNLYMTYKYLGKKNRGLKLRSSNRPLTKCYANKPTTINMQFLLEVEFIENEDELRSFIKNRNLGKKQRWKEAFRFDMLVSCQCCLDDQLLEEDTIRCRLGHTFCKRCISRYIDTGLQNGKCEFRCLDMCDEMYSLHLIQDLVKPETFTVLVEVSQMLGIETLGMEDVVRCPFCNYATILSPEMTVFCSNLDCLKETCRLCKEVNHWPSSCEKLKISKKSEERIEA